MDRHPGDLVIRCPATGRQVFTGMRAEAVGSINVVNCVIEGCSRCGGSHTFSTPDLERWAPSRSGLRLFARGAALALLGLLIAAALYWSVAGIVSSV